MLIRDFHSKLVSGKEEGRLFEVLRKLKGFEGAKALTTTESSPWSVWTDEPSLSLAAAKA
jgi:hypothetical protein